MFHQPRLFFWSLFGEYEMVFCIQCGKQITEEDYYCQYCGYVNTSNGAQLSSERSLIDKLRVTTDRTLKKSFEVGVKTSEELLDLSKKGVKKVKKAVSSETDPLTIARIRYAKGEISQHEYEEMKKVLQVAR